MGVGDIGWGPRTQQLLLSPHRTQESLADLELSWQSALLAEKTWLWCSALCKPDVVAQVQNPST